MFWFVKYAEAQLASDQHYAVFAGGSLFPAEPRYDDEVTSFTVEARTQLKARLLEFANHDPRLSGAAVTGSAAAGREDRWSDIDLAFGVADPALVGAVLSDFSDFMSAHRIHLSPRRSGRCLDLSRVLLARRIASGSGLR